MVWKPDYATLAEGKSFLRLGDTVDDVEIAIWITAASRAIDDTCNRQFGVDAAPSTRTYRRTPAYDPMSGLWWLEIDDLMSTTGLTVGGIAYASSGAVLGPEQASYDGKPWTRLGFNAPPYPSSPGAPITVVAVGTFGWTAVPAAVKGAVRLQLNRWAQRRDSPTGISGSPDQGSEMRLLAKLDPDVLAMLKPVRRRRRAG